MALRAVIALTSLLLLFGCGVEATDGPAPDRGSVTPDAGGGKADSTGRDGRPILPVLGHWAWRRVCHEGKAINQVTVAAQPSGCGDELVAPYLRIRFDDTEPLSHISELGSEQRISVGGATVLAELCRAEGRCEQAISGWVAAAAGGAGELRVVEVALDFAGVSVRLRSPMFELCAPGAAPG